MVLFGELVIPSSRALWDDESEYEQINTAISEWQGNKVVVPSNISTILLIETKKLNNLAKTCLEKDSKPLYYITNPNVSMYKLLENNYLILCDDEQEFFSGEVADKLVPWLINSKQIICITSKCSALFQNNVAEELPPCFIRAIANGNVESVFTPLLTAPNLVTGVTAGVMSYCQHINKSAVSYLCYTDSGTLDSVTADPILQLLQNIHIPTAKPFTYKPAFKTVSNLYM